MHRPMKSPKETFNLATQLHAQGRFSEAEGFYRQLLQAKPEDPQLLHLLGVAVLQQNRPDEAIALIKQAIEHRPGVAEYHNNLGVVLDALEKREEALEHYQLAIRYNPKYAEARNNLGGSLAAIGKIDEAIAEYQRAVELKPDYAEAWDNLGSTLRLALRNYEAIAAYDQAIKLQPNFAYSHYNRGTLMLALGKFEEGWDDFEWRWKCPTFNHPDRNFDKPLWDGSELMGKTILLHAEQGLGDTIHFVRYASTLANRNAKVIVEAQPKLASLLAEVPGVSQAISRGDALPDFDCHIPVMSIPRLLKTTLRTIPREMPYILPPAIAHENWRSTTRADALKEGKKKLRVGLAWAGNPASHIDKKRSLAIEMLAPLAAAPNVRFYSLQVGPAAAQIEKAPFPIIDHTAKLTDFIQTAGLVANLDLVICVDTVIAHLAGAMNHRVWMLTYTPPDWRWMFDREDSPWYPTMKLFRQKTPGQWDDPIAQVADQLKKLGERLNK